LLCLPANKEREKGPRVGFIRFIEFLQDRNAIIVNIFFFAALKLTQRTSTSAFDTKIKIKIQQEEFTEALKLLNEWRMVDPQVRDIID